MAKNEGLAKVIEERIGTNVYLCYQCKKCTSGCPLSEHFDLVPHQVMRAIQLGKDGLALSSRTAWLCASCLTCSTRCPQELDVARIMDVVKMVGQEQGIRPAVPEVAMLYRSFLRGVRILGRSYELGIMGELNLRTGQLFKDVPMGLELLRKGRVKLLPTIARPKEGSRAQPGQVAYYPGCSLHSLSSDYDISVRAVLRELGVDLVEPKGWICCGSTPAHATDDFLASLLPYRNLTMMERMGFKEVIVPCASCFSRFKTTLKDMADNPKLRDSLSLETGYEFQGSLEVKGMLQALTERIGVIRERITRPLHGLKVVCYYGCLLTRPPEVTGAEKAEYPSTMEDIVAATGATSLDWSYKTDCCGATLSLSKTELALELSARILRNAAAVGAEAVVVACPLCHTNLDARQNQMGLQFSLPILYITQAVGLALGLEPKRVALDRSLVNARGLLLEKSLIDK